MNIIDLVIGLLLLIALFNGWRRGFIMQACSLVAIVAAIFLAAEFGEAVGTALNLSPSLRSVGGFAVVLVVALIAISILSRVVRGLLHWVGLGIFDNLLGVVIAVAKYMLVVSALLMVLDKFNLEKRLFSEETIATSRTYRPVKELAGKVLPFLEQVMDGVDDIKKEEPTEEQA